MIKDYLSTKEFGSIFRLAKSKLNILMITLVLVNILLAGVYYFWPAEKPVAEKYPEIAVLASKDKGMKELQEFFVNVAQTKSAVYAYELLKVAPIAENIDLHLLGHTVGDELFQQKGLDGILYCGHEFRNACSHTIVIGEFKKSGEDSLGEIKKVCQKAPGGKGAYAMCYHGLGHGVLAYVGYDLAEAVRICQKSATANPKDREFMECVGGVIMELVGGGDHDRELWRSQSVKYVNEKNPLSPCNTSLIPNEVKGMCYVYLTPHLFELTGAKNGNPSDGALTKSFRFCDQIPESEKVNRDICYAGFGKEFVVLAKKRDIRNIDKISADEMGRIIKWCLLTDNIDGKRTCFGGVISSIYWGGENPVQPAVDFCKMLDSQFRDGCFRGLNGSVKSYSKTDSEYRDFCNKLPSDQQKLCDFSK